MSFWRSSPAPVDPNIAKCYIFEVKVLGADRLVDFGRKHPQARSAITTFRATLEACAAKNIVELKQTFRSVDYVRPYFVFDVGGNNYRIVVLITFTVGVATVQKAMTHAEYDAWKP
jgi:mRNA interferase HigB